MKTELLRSLKSADGFVSGQELCRGLHVSRTAVWKGMEALKAAGYEIEAVPRKGYRLMSCPDEITREALLSEKTSKWILNDAICFEETDSTNEQAKHYAEKGAEEGTLFCADKQTGGKGRKGRGFISPPGVGIFMSLLLRPKVRIADASRITLVAALAVQEGIFLETGISCRIKWPNDIVHEGKKLTGILTEMSLEEDRISYIVTGIGINVNNDTFSPEIRDIATSLLLETGKKTFRPRLIAKIMDRFENNYEVYLKTGDLSELKDHYNELLVNRDRQVRVLDETVPYDGTAVGINEKGELLVRTGKEVRRVSFGEVSVRGVYGYV